MVELITITNGVLVAAIIGLTLLLKKVWPDRYITLLPPLFGILGVGFTAGWTAQSIITGIIFGLVAEGFYDQKLLFKAKKLVDGE